MSVLQLKVEVDESLKARVAEKKGATTWRALVENLFTQYLAAPERAKAEQERAKAEWNRVRAGILVAVDHCMMSTTRIQNAKFHGPESAKVVQYDLVEEVIARLRAKEG